MSWPWGRRGRGAARLLGLIYNWADMPVHEGAHARPEVLVLLIKLPGGGVVHGTLLSPRPAVLAGISRKLTNVR